MSLVHHKLTVEICPTSTVSHLSFSGVDKSQQCSWSCWYALEKNKDSDSIKILNIWFVTLRFLFEGPSKSKVITEDCWTTIREQLNKQPVLLIQGLTADTKLLLKKCTFSPNLHPQCHEYDISCEIWLVTSSFVLPARLAGPRHIWTFSPCRAQLYDLKKKSRRVFKNKPLGRNCQIIVVAMIWIHENITDITWCSPCMKYLVNLPELGMDSHQLPASLTVRTPDFTSCLGGQGVGHVLRNIKALLILITAFTFPVHNN